MQFDDKYIRDYAFEPEILLERTNSVDFEQAKVNRYPNKAEKSRRGRISLFIHPPKTIVEIQNEDLDEFGESSNNSHNNNNSNNHQYKGSYSILNEIQEISEVDKEVDEFYCVSRQE